MPQRLIHFATNRIWDQPRNAFGFVCEDPASRLWLGRVGVEVSTDPLNEGQVGLPQVEGFDDFSGDPGRTGSAAGVLASWLAMARARQAVPILMVHGFNYSFTEACARASSLCDILQAQTGLLLEPLAFTWPSNGIGNPSAYKDDQGDCEASGTALARLIRQIAAAATDAAAKPAYLAHSMGARATRCAVQVLQKQGGLPQRLFGQAVIIAGDENTDAMEPGRGPMWPLTELAEWTTIGVFPADTTLTLVSGWLNGRQRLGAAGPETLPMPQQRAFVVDYGLAVTLKDWPGMTSFNDVGHQYYRNDRRVLADLGQALRGMQSPDSIPGRRWAVVDDSVAIREQAGRLYVI